MKYFFFFIIIVLGYPTVYSQEQALTTNGKIISVNADASTSQKGIIQLSGDLGGTSANPTIANGVITTAKLANSSVTNAKIVGPISVANGGTGVTSLSGYIKGNGTNAFSSVTAIPATDITGVVKRVNGQLPDANGNASVSLVSASIGTLNNRPTTSTIGNIYVVSGDGTAANNGKFFICTAVSPTITWAEVTPNMATFDATYLALTGGTMNGNIVVPASKTITIADAPSNTIDVVNKLYVDTKFNSSLATSNTIGLMSATDKSKLDNLPSNLSLSTFTSKLVFWDALTEPTLTNAVFPYTSPPTTFGTPLWVPSSATPTFAIPTNNSYQLTPNSSSNLGGIRWNFSLSSFLYIKYKIKANSTVTTDDNLWFHCFSSAVPKIENGTETVSGIHSDGYIVSYNDSDRKIRLYWGNSSSALITSANACWTTNDNLFHTLKLFILTNRVFVYADDSLVLSYTDPVSRNLNGTFFGFGARSSNSATGSTHDIRGLSIEKYYQGTGGAISPTITDF